MLHLISLATKHVNNCVVTQKVTCNQQVENDKFAVLKGDDELSQTKISRTLSGQHQCQRQLCWFSFSFNLRVKQKASLTSPIKILRIHLYICFCHHYKTYDSYISKFSVAFLCISYPLVIASPFPIPLPRPLLRAFFLHS